tara:strand:+ start:108 stop:1064 length:957 start_codon:yes stop_codon:yes gene_type:complete
MKISFGSKIIEGPWGGGNLFLINLKEYLEANGHTIVFDLKDKDIDIILFTDPRKGRGSTSTFGEKEIKKYISKINKKTRVVQRINECDERKNTKGVNKLYLSSTEIADSVVFVSNWLQDIYLQLGLDENKSTVIMSGSNELIFNSYGRTEKPVNKKFKLLTHHWSSNYLKGFELYSLIDQLLETNKWRNKIEFTYLGNVDKEFAFKNTKIIAPLSGFELANEIKEHDIYVTGSLNEPSGNHHIEAALCGLPVLYINSGGVPEYAKNYGVEVTLKNFEERLEYLIEYYGQFEKKMKSYPYNSTAMCEKYEKLFNKVLNQ